MKISLIIFILMIQTTDLRAASHPSWVEKQPSSDAEYKYYVGRSGLASSERDAVTESLQDASEQAIQENFGFMTKVMKGSYSSINSANVDANSIVVSDQVRLVGFERMKIETEAAPSGFVAWALYRYPVKEIEIERTRLVARKNTDENENFSETGELNHEHPAEVAIEVTTLPKGAEVFIDQIRWGVTPVRIKTGLTQGEHTLKIDHHCFETKSESFTAIPGLQLKRNLVLYKAKGHIEVNSNQLGATVKINERNYGYAPIKSVELPACSSAKVEVSGSNSEKIVTYEVVKKDEEVKVYLKFPEREPAMVAPVPVVETKAETREDTDEVKPHTRNSLDLNMSFSSRSSDKMPSAMGYGSFGGRLNLGLLWVFGVRAGLSYDYGETESTGLNNKYWSLHGSSVDLGPTITFYQSENANFYGFYEWGKLSHKYSQNYKSEYADRGGKLESKALTQKRRLVGVGTKIYPDPKSNIGLSFEIIHNSNDTTKVGDGITSFTSNLGLTIGF